MLLLVCHGNISFLDLDCDLFNIQVCYYCSVMVILCIYIKRSSCVKLGNDLINVRLCSKCCTFYRLINCRNVVNNAWDKRDPKTVSALEVVTLKYLNLSQLSTRSLFAKRTCLTEACPRCIALVLL